VLGKTAGSLFWMFRYLERCENTARFTEAGFYIALTRYKSAEDEWQSIIQAAGAEEHYNSLNNNYDGATVINYLLREKDNPSSVRSIIDLARSNARTARTALTREVWEAVNEAWLNICSALKKPTILRSVSANQSYRWMNKGVVTPKGIANFLLLDFSMPRSLAFCQSEIVHNLVHLTREYDVRHESHSMSMEFLNRLMHYTIDEVMDQGLHEFINMFLAENRALAGQIEKDYRFYT